ncbi:MAG: META domain-containing protein [Bacteroidales bacterium]|jgi:heat shock protein HslJ|nr:META domain-containing protein [Bacteroidales bacterium]
MKTIVYIGGIIVAAIVVSACASRKAQEIVVIDTISADYAAQQVAQRQPSLTATRWNLVELNGKPLSEMTVATQPFIVFDTVNTRVSGSLGCNNFSATYTLNASAQRISFAQITSTQMACIDMTVEAQLSAILPTIDNYSINGDTLSLNRARMAPLARFAAAR